MKRSITPVALVVCLFAAASCSRQSANLTSPSVTGPGGIAANPDGSSLKVSAPTVVSPANGLRLPNQSPVVLVLSNSTGVYASTIALTYRFEVLTAGGQVAYTSPLVPQGSGGTTSHTVAIQLDGEAPYTWQARAIFQDVTGPVSARGSFFAPPTEGYIKDNEMYDPLINGKTAGTIHGAVKFIPGVGAQVLDSHSWIEYRLGNQLTQGEFSGIFTNISVISNNEDPKWRLITMRECCSAINDNIYRMSVDKRGNGAIAWRFVSGDNRGGEYIETIGAEREVQAFHEALDYFVQATWRNNFFNVLFKENGYDGTVIYNRGKPYGGIYQPLPHELYLGSPYAPGDRGEPSSVADMIARQLWVSAAPRPSGINK